MQHAPRWIVTFALLIFAGCTLPAGYSWQDLRQPTRKSAASDIQYCKEFTASQYSPAIPSGAHYIAKRGMDAVSQHGEWKSDQSPFKNINIYYTPTHDIPVDYTGYPGELDYYPEYLDDIFEKCMNDKGWEYLPAPEATPNVEHGSEKFVEPEPRPWGEN